MGFLSYLFPRAGEVEMLTRQCQFYRDQTEHLESKVALLEKSIKSERRRYDKFQAVYYDQISAAHKLRPQFSNIEEKPKENLPPDLTPDEEGTLEYIAKEMYQQELSNGGNRGLHEYQQAVRDNADYYLSQAN